MAVNAYLHFDDQEYRLLNLHYHYEQAVEVTGRPMAKPTGGQFRIRLNATDKSKDNFLPWMLDPEGVKNGTVFVYGHDLLQVEKTIHFTDAYCIYHSLEFLSTGSAPLILDVVISARKLEINGEVYENPWPKISDYQGLEAPKRVASSSAQPVQKQEQAEAPTSVTPAPPPPPNTIVLGGGSKGGWNKELSKTLKPNAQYYVDGYTYHTDNLGRVNRVTGQLQDLERGRNKYQQTKSVSLKDGQKGKGKDQGGHIIAQRFLGPGEQINYLPMAEKLNQGGWKEMENGWAKALIKVPPDTVEVDIRAVFKGDSKKPVGFVVVSKTIDGITKEEQIDNFRFKN